MRAYSAGGRPGKKARRTALSTSGRPERERPSRPTARSVVRERSSASTHGGGPAERQHVAAEGDDGGHVVRRVQSPGERHGGAERVPDEERPLEAELGGRRAQHGGLRLRRAAVLRGRGR